MLIQKCAVQAPWRPAETLLEAVEMSGEPQRSEEEEEEEEEEYM